MTSLLRYESPLDRVFDRAFGGFFAPANGRAANGATIDLDVIETPEAYIVKAEVPGVPKDKIEVKVEDRDVAIGVEYAEALEANGKTLWRERRLGKASRAIRLPEAVDVSAAQARHLDGVLELTLPKLAKANARRITIQ
jgi:HSP20 family protein